MNVCIYMCYEGNRITLYIRLHPPNYAIVAVKLDRLDSCCKWCWVWVRFYFILIITKFFLFYSFYTHCEFSIPARCSLNAIFFSCLSLIICGTEPKNEGFVSEKTSPKF